MSEPSNHQITSHSTRTAQYTPTPMDFFVVHFSIAHNTVDSEPSFPTNADGGGGGSSGAGCLIA